VVPTVVQMLTVVPVVLGTLPNEEDLLKSSKREMYHHPPYYQELIDLLDELEAFIREHLDHSQSQQVNSALGFIDFRSAIDHENETFDRHINEENDSLVTSPLKHKVRLGNQLINKKQAANLCKARLNQITIALQVSEEVPIKPISFRTSRSPSPAMKSSARLSSRKSRLSRRSTEFTSTRWHQQFDLINRHFQHHITDWYFDYTNRRGMCFVVLTIS
jgi:hypothetical protein